MACIFTSTCPGFYKIVRHAHTPVTSGSSIFLVWLTRCTRVVLVWSSGVGGRVRRHRVDKCSFLSEPHHLSSCLARSVAAVAPQSRLSLPLLSAAYQLSVTQRAVASATRAANALRRRQVCVGSRERSPQQPLCDCCAQWLL